MKMYLDCEFNGFGGELISMALVTETGEEWYEVLPCLQPSEWVSLNVIPVLGKTPIDLSLFQRRLYDWLAQYDHVHIVADWPEDIALFCTSLITGAGRRLNTPPLTLQIVSLNIAHSNIPHNALHDARAIREAMLAVK